MTDSHSTQTTSDCYSAGERGWMEFGQRIRARLLHPLLISMTRAGIRSDAITVLSGLAGVAFLPAWLTGQRALAVAFLTLHVLLDGLDGPCARFQGSASPRGSFTDTIVDQIVVTTVSIAWMIGRPSPLAIGLSGAYIFLYMLVVAMAMVRNALAIPFSWLVRPRFFVFAAMALEVAGVTWVTEPTLAIACILLATKASSGFFYLRRKIPGPGGRLEAEN
jgi:phosphatidylglycerophosphate synthase